jgi:DNA-binding transcriptional ArsR family regulator
MRHSADQLVQCLRAAAEPTRLRLLVVLSRGEFSVGELTEILGQSQPRVSRHLRLLGDCGLLERFREQHWIYYRVPVEGDGAQFVGDLLAKLADDDPVTAGDAVRVSVFQQPDLTTEARVSAPSDWKVSPRLWLRNWRMRSAFGDSAGDGVAAHVRQALQEIDGSQ